MILTTNPTFCKTFPVGNETFRAVFIFDGEMTYASVCWQEPHQIMVQAGASMCHPKDTYDQAIGMKVAMRQACIGMKPASPYFGLHARFLYGAFRKWLHGEVGYIVPCPISVPKKTRKAG
jgi:hypothetical protein